MTFKDFQTRFGLVVNTNIIVANSTNGTVGVNTAAAAVTLDIQANDAIRLPVGNTGQQPTSSNGLIRFNSDTQAPEYAIQGVWLSIAGLFGEIGAI